MPRMPEVRHQVSVALAKAQREWVNAQARKRGISAAEFIRRLIDGMMLGDNTMSRGVDWQSQTLPTPVEDVRALRRQFVEPLPDILPAPAKSTAQSRAEYVGVEAETGTLVTSGMVRKEIPIIKSTPMGPNHPFYKEYVDALRAGDHQKAAQLRFGTMGRDGGEK